MKYFKRNPSLIEGQSNRDDCPILLRHQSSRRSLAPARESEHAGMPERWKNVSYKVARPEIQMISLRLLKTVKISSNG
jgi:hypothetical protein